MVTGYSHFCFKSASSTLLCIITLLPVLLHLCLNIVTLSKFLVMATSWEGLEHDLLLAETLDENEVSPECVFSIGRSTFELIY